MFPWSPILKSAPDELVSGLSLLATQTVVLSGMFLYHIPTYHFELPGSKKPSSNTPLDETMVWLSVSDSVAVMVSKELTGIVEKERMVMVILIHRMVV